MKTLPVRYVVEPTQGNYGKSHALNRALAADRLGGLVVVLDDDMTVESGWWHGIAAISRRHPQADFFTGRGHVIWPSMELPAWASDPSLQGWLFSVRAGSATDRPLSPGQWFSGNFFWFRSRVVQAGHLFSDIWLTEPQFMLDLTESGLHGVQGPDAVVGHRIQSRLLEPEFALPRAALSGKHFARARLVPFRSSVPNAQRAARHPILARAYCAANLAYWSCRSWHLREVSGDSPRFAARLHAVQKAAASREAIEILRADVPYRRLRDHLHHSPAAAVPRKIQ
jgi:hypothetical protein